MNHRSESLPVLTASFLLFLIITGCHMPGWNKLAQGRQAAPPQEIQSIFQSYPGGVYQVEALTPGYDYIYDVGEKAQAYGREDMRYRFDQVQMRLHPSMPEGTVLVDFTFRDGVGNVVEVPAVDLIRLTPKMDFSVPMAYPEVILEELNRFGLSFRKEHGEFRVHSSDPLLQNAYRLSITNNCLDPGKWEFALVTEDYSDFKQRTKSFKNINQNRLLSHSWFQVDLTLYQALLDLKNPGTAYPVAVNFDSISNLAEQVVIDWDQLRRPLRRSLPVELLEVGHQSRRRIEPVDVEEHFKWQFGLWLNRQEGMDYASILETEVSTAKFMEQGFYRDDTPRKFDFSWMKHMDSVQVSVVDVPGSDCYVELKLTGPWSWFEVTIGNVDLALLNEQKRHGMLFGMNTYPKSRRYNPSQATLAYDQDFLPRDIRPYVLLTEKQSGKWVNNQYKGIEKIYLSYESLEKDVLEIYVLSYERILPVWMARVKLPKDVRESVRIRNAIYNY